MKFAVAAALLAALFCIAQARYTLLFDVNKVPANVANADKSNDFQIDELKRHHHKKNHTKEPKEHGGEKDPKMQALVDKMYAADTDRPGPNDFKLDWGNHVSGEQDESQNPLFSFVNESIFQKPVYSKLIDMYNRNLFTADVCKAEPDMGGFRKQILMDVMKTFTATPMFQAAFQYLQEEGVAQGTLEEFLPELFTLWFGTYSRCHGALGSSGWEHVFLGEWKGSTVDGQHDWVRYYLLEKAGKINYHGYDKYDGQLTGTFQYTWEDYLKKTGGFLIHTSPAFDFSLFTACVYTHSGSDGCKFTIEGYELGVTSYKQKCDDGTCLSTSYPTN
uniref:Endoribonuclease n=1 Tax=Steinernema glaseri TaxID=37863 RepID=A0A1I7Y6E0_9BILA